MEWLNGDTYIYTLNDEHDEQMGFYEIDRIYANTTTGSTFFVEDGTEIEIFVPQPGQTGTGGDTSNTTCATTNRGT